MWMAGKTACDVLLLPVGKLTQLQSNKAFQNFKALVGIQDLPLCFRGLLLMHGLVPKPKQLFPAEHSKSNCRIWLMNLVLADFR